MVVITLLWLFAMSLCVLGVIVRKIYESLRGRIEAVPMELQNAAASTMPEVGFALRILRLLPLIGRGCIGGGLALFLVGLVGLFAPGLALLMQSLLVLVIVAYLALFAAGFVWLKRLVPTLIKFMSLLPPPNVSVQDRMIDF